MNFVLIIIIIICLIIIIGPIIINNNLLAHLVKTIPLKSISDIEFRTGDILLYRWNYSVLTIPKERPSYFNDQSLYTILVENSLVTYVYGTVFLHGGIVVIYNGKPYILEISEEHIYCNFDKKMSNYSPSLSSLDELTKYTGAICRIPYIGPKIKDNVVLQMLQSKHQYSFAWHPDYGMARSFSYYLYDDMPDYDTCGPIIESITNNKCPYYVNCLQFVCAMMIYMKISDKKYCMKTSPSSLSDFCESSDKYGQSHLIETPYLLEYC